MGGFNYAWEFMVFPPFFFISILLACDFRIEVAALLKTSVITYTGAW
jgi:hypothetical protein